MRGIINNKNVFLTLASCHHNVDIPCIVEDTRVVITGNIKIQDLTEDDVIITHSGRVLPIEAILN